MSNHTKKNITIGDEALKYVDQYIYLGKQVGFCKHSNEQEVERRGQKTWKNTGALKKFLKAICP